MDTEQVLSSLPGIYKEYIIHPQKLTTFVIQQRQVLITYQCYFIIHPSKHPRNSAE